MDAFRKGISIEVYLEPLSSFGWCHVVCTTRIWCLQVKFTEIDLPKKVRRPIPRQIIGSNTTTFCNLRLKQKCLKLDIDYQYLC